jgi:transcriptional regulator with XRE-family HTH domain
MTLGGMLALSREIKGMSLRHLASVTGISDGLLSQIETGHVKNPSFSNVVKVSRALGVKLDRLAETVF